MNQTLKPMNNIPMCRIALLSLVAVGVVGEVAAETPARPNVIIIVADDLGYGDTSVYGGWVKTPNLERMAAEGMLFTDFHSNSSVCSPTRAAFMTGRYQQRVGIVDVVARHLDTPGLRPVELTLPRLMKNGGYRTALFGKWHLGTAPEHNPIHHGFDEFRGYLGGYVDYHVHENSWYDGTEKKNQKGYSTHLITENSVRFIEANRSRAFFLVVAHEAVHLPFQTPEDTPGNRKPIPKDERWSRARIRPKYKVMLEVLDEGIGEILDTVRRTGISDRTLVFFFSDNGAIGAGSNKPFRGGKFSHYEGGHRVPAIAWWPGKIRPGSRSCALTMGMDLLPTVAELASIQVPGERKLDGSSMLDLLLHGDEFPARELFFGYEPKLGTAMRFGKWKMIVKGDRVELYDLENDIGERDNLVGKHPERARRMKDAIETWKEATAAPPPAKEKRPSGAAAEPDHSATSSVTPFAVPTFHCLGVYWSPEEGGVGKKVSVQYRESGQSSWRAGLPMRYNPVDTPECKADYRGSIVNLGPGRRYEIALQLEGTGIRSVLTAATWSERFPVASVVRSESRNRTLDVGESGTPEGYVLYDGRGCTIDTGDEGDVGIAVRASYVILRGFRIENVKQHGIRLFSGHHIVIEDCDISRWGSEDEKGFGKNYQACVFSNERDLHSVVIQRCKFHHPSWDSNSWAERHGKSNHPAGPQTVVFWESAGNHVIRYNECWSDANHYFNDVMGAGYNGGYRGFPGADSDIYGNYIANAWDDGIEAEGGDQNVRIWNNYMEEVLIPIANAAASIGPLYAWRNVSGRCYSPPGSNWDMTHGPFFKMGYAGGEQWMTGHMYIFNNTIFQPDGEGSSGLGGSSRIIKHCVTRNNILHVRKSDGRSISTGKSVDNDFDHDLLSARHPDDQEDHGISGEPKYASGAGFNFETKTGSFELDPDSPGYDKGVVIPNFCDVFTGEGPDVGAHEAGSAAMKFGVETQFVPSSGE